jgi:CheY-like chemotaxis protein
MSSELHSVNTMSLFHQAGHTKGAVLVVDDEAAIRTALALLLEDNGYTVLQARNGAEALDLLRAIDQPVVVLLDQMMPVMTGLDVLEAVEREQDRLGRLGRHAYIFMSGAFPTGLRHVASLPQILGVTILIKPFALKLMLQKVEEAAAHITHSREESQRDDGRLTG